MGRSSSSRSRSTPCCNAASKPEAQEAYSMIELGGCEVWFLTGSQHLYGAETLEQVERQSSRIVAALDDQDAIPVTIRQRPVLTTPEAIESACREANAA